jgi:hypothetical protein
LDRDRLKVPTGDDRFGRRFGFCCLMREQRRSQTWSQLSEQPVFRCKIA